MNTSKYKQPTEFNLIELKETDSTNLNLRELCDTIGKEVTEFTTVRARYQTAGKGQRGNSWESEKDKNLLFSVVLYPTFLEARLQFIISQIISLAIQEELSCFSDHIRIKWPNDIYYQEKKICGILIENDLCGIHLSRCICGIGLNINQETFYSDAPNPISLKQITNQNHNCQEVLNHIIQRIQDYYQRLKNEKFDTFAATINERYALALFRREGLYPYKDDNGKFMARLVRVEPDGRFILEDEGGAIRSYLFKEVQYLL